MTVSIAEDRLEAAIADSFECVRCGHCCKGDGLVRFGPREAERMAARLGLTTRQFLKTYAIRIEPNRWLLQDRMVPGERPGEAAEQWCVLLTREPDGRYGCRVQDAKPDQCARFPQKWRNPDSLVTCAGLRRLGARLRRAQNAEAG